MQNGVATCQLSLSKLPNIIVDCHHHHIIHPSSSHHPVCCVAAVVCCDMQRVVAVSCRVLPRMPCRE